MLYKTNFHRAALNLIKQYGDSADLYAEEQFEKHCEAGDVKEAGWCLASDFGSYGAQTDAEERAARELAQIFNQLLSVFFPDL